MALEPWVEENYAAIVADEARHETFESIAADADEKNSPELAAWARGEAAKSGKHVTPKDAKPDVKSVRDKK